MRGRGWLFCLLGALCLLLLLSALVEAPASDEAKETATKGASMLQSVALLPFTIPTRENHNSIAEAVFPLLYTMLFPGLLACAAATAIPFGRDANGRWIRKKRYVNSVYQVFRQELASG